MRYALHMMLVKSPDHRVTRYKPNSRWYELARSGLSKAVSEANKGKAAWNKGIPRPQYVKDAVSAANKGRVAWNKGKARTLEEKAAMKAGWSRRKETLDHRPWNKKS